MEFDVEFGHTMGRQFENGIKAPTQGLGSGSPPNKPAHVEAVTSDEIDMYYRSPHLLAEDREAAVRSFVEANYPNYRSATRQRVIERNHRLKKIIRELKD